MVPNWLLRLFPRIRALEAEASNLRAEHFRLTQEIARLQDRLDAALDDRSRMWDLMQRSVDEMRISYQSHINVQWQRMSGGVPYPDAPHLPPSAVPHEQPGGSEPIGRRGRLLPSEAIAQRTADFIQSTYGQG